MTINNENEMNGRKRCVKMAIIMKNNEENEMKIWRIIMKIMK